MDESTISSLTRELRETRELLLSVAEGLRTSLVLRGEHGHHCATGKAEGCTCWRSKADADLKTTGAKGL